MYITIVTVAALLVGVHAAPQDLLPSPTTVASEVNEVVAKPNVYWMHIDTNVKYRYANTAIKSRVANPAEKAQEYVFHVVLPDPAFITGFVMTIKEKNYTAYVKEKEEAKKEYDQAVSQGLSAAHVAYNARDSNEFKVSMNIEPKGKVDFILTYEELLKRELGQYKHEINVHPGQLVEDLKITVNIQDVLPITDVQVPELKISNEISPEEVPNALAKIEHISPENVTVVWAPSIDEQKELKAEGVSGQFIVKYDVDRSANPQQILVSDGYFVHYFADDDLPSLNKHVVFILDISGSMAGKKMSQLKTAMNKILSDLKPTDYFSIVLFSNKADVWALGKPTKEMINRVGYGSYHNPEEDTKPSEVEDANIIPVNEENIKEAKQFIDELDDTGGTNIIAGLRVGLKLTKLGAGKFAEEVKSVNKPHPVVVFLTDGEPNIEESNPKAITNKTTIQNTDKYPIFSLGFGNGADIKFLRSLSLSNNGFARHIYEASDAALQLDKFFQSISSPKLADIKFIYPEDQVSEDTTKTVFPGLYSGSELLVTGRLADGHDKLTGKLTAAGAEGVKEFSLPPIRPLILIDPPIVSPQPANRTYGPLEKMWAYQSIKQLLEKTAISENPEAKKKALDLALKYSFVTELTSLVVVKPNETTAVDAEQAGSGRRPGFPGMLSGFAGSPNFALHSASFPAAPAGAAIGFGGGFAGGARPGMPGMPGLAGPPPPSDLVVDSMPASSMKGRPTATWAPQHMMSTIFATTTVAAPTKSDEELSEPNQILSEMIIDYHNVTWLATDLMEKEGQFFIKPPATVSDTALIALNVTSTAYDSCQAGGEAGHCKHFIHCALNIFEDNLDVYNDRFKCFVDTKFVGVCCPDSLSQTPVP